MSNLLFAEGTSSTLYLVGIIGLMFVLTYFMSIRPQKKRQKEHQAMLSDLKKGDQIMTIGGFKATVFSVGDDDLIVELMPSQTKVTITKQAIGSKQIPETEGE